jgi:hypothetical protein
MQRRSPVFLSDAIAGQVGLGERRRHALGFVRPRLRSAISGSRKTIHIEFFYAHELSLANKQNAAFTP